MYSINSTPLHWDPLLPAENTAEELAEMATAAIFGSSDHNTQKLQGVLQQGLVDATTRSATGETLLMLTVRIDKPTAFENLVLDFPEFRAPEFNQQDLNGDTVLHYFARHRDHNTFEPGVQADWRRVVVRNFLDLFNKALDWSVRNNEGETAPELARKLGKSHLVGIMKSYSAKSTSS